jgi:hypothetical protein
VNVAEPGDVEAMDVMVMMAVAANIFVGLGRDRRSNHGHNKSGGAKEFQSDHLSLLTYNDKTTRGKAGFQRESVAGRSSSAQISLSSIPAFRDIPKNHEPARQDRHKAFHLSA